MSALDDAWRRYCEASMAQIYAVAALDEIPDIAELEAEMRLCD